MIAPKQGYAFSDSCRVPGRPAAGDRFKHWKTHTHGRDAETRQDRHQHSGAVATEWPADEPSSCGGGRPFAQPCLSRVKRLEKAGYIVGYNARLQLSRLVEHITVFTEVTLLDHRREDFLKFESSIRRCSALKECHLVSGGYDYLLKFVVRNIDRYQATMEAMLESDIGIEKYFSYVVLKTVIDLESVPLASLIEDA